MTKFALLATVAMVAHMSDMVPVVLATPKGGDGPVRINQSDFDADQALPAGDRQFTPYKGKDEAQQPEATSPKTFDELGIQPQAAPSAPNFSTNGEAPPALIDPIKNAVAPAIPSSDDRLVMKDGKKFFVVNAMGEKLTIDGIDEAGYTTEKAARDAIDAL